MNSETITALGNAIEHAPLAVVAGGLLVFVVLKFTALTDFILTLVGRKPHGNQPCTRAEMEQMLARIQQSEDHNHADHKDMQASISQLGQRMAGVETQMEVMNASLKDLVRKQS